MTNKFNTYTSLNDTTRYVVLFNNEEGRQCRIDCYSCQDLDNVGDFKMYSPIYIYKVDKTLKIHGKARKKFIDNLVLKQTAGIKIIRQIEDCSKILTKKELSILLCGAVQTWVYSDSKMSSRVQAIVYGGNTEKYRVNNIELVCTKYNYIDIFVVKNLLAFNPHLITQLKILFKIVQKSA